MIKVLEELATFTPLGIRFWDPVMDEQIRDSLKVTARPQNKKGPIIQAFRTVSDVYAFNNLPGMRSIEHRLQDFDSIVSPPDKYGFIIEVEDIRRRYIKVAFQVNLPLPYKGIFLSQLPSSSPQTSQKGFLLFSAPTRTRPSWLAVIRGELVDFNTGNRAAHAVVRISTLHGNRWYGLADENGNFSVLLSYPTIEGSFVGSPQTFISNPLNSQSWDLFVEVLYNPNQLVPIPYTTVPDYLSILSQEKAQIWLKIPGNGSPAEEGSYVSELLVTLEFGREMILRTKGQYELIISPTVSSP